MLRYYMERMVCNSVIRFETCDPWQADALRDIGWRLVEIAPAG